LAQNQNFSGVENLLRKQGAKLEIITQCPFCGYIERVDEKWADRRKRCTKCRNLFSVPSLEKLPEATAVIKKMNGRIYVDRSGNTYG